MSVNNMKQLLILLFGLFGVAYGQYSPTSAKTKFVNGISIGSKDSTYFTNAGDTIVLYFGRDSAVYARFKGVHRRLAYAGGTDFVPYTGAVTNVNLGNYRLTARSIKTDSIYANSSAGMYLTTNTGTAVAHWGGGGSVEVDFKGFAGYDANRASSYTARSFTDKNYVDSAAGLRVRYTDTAAMLTPFVQYSDTANMLSPYARSVNVAGTYKAIADTFFTTGYTTRARTKQVIDSLGAVKQNVLTNPVTGAGTTNTIPKITGTSTIGNSNISDNGSQITLSTYTLLSSPLKVSNRMVIGSGFIADTLGTGNNTGLQFGASAISPTNGAGSYVSKNLGSSASRWGSYFGTTGEFSGGVTAQRGRFTSLVANKDSIPITTSNFWALQVDTSGTPYTNRINRRDISAVHTGTIAFDTSSRTLTINQISGGSTSVVIPRGTASGTSGITALSSTRTGNLVTVSGDNGSSTIFSVRDADSSNPIQSLTASYGISGSPFNGTAPLTWLVDTSQISTKANVSGLLVGYATTGANALKLNISDTSAMLSNYNRKSDTANMLSPYLRKSDTATMLANRLRISDTLTMLSNRFKTSDTATLLSKTVRTFGNQTVSGEKTYSSNSYWDSTKWIGMGNTNPLAPIHVGNRNVLNSSLARILVAGNYNNSFSTNGHGFSDGSNLTRSSGLWAYAAYDGRVDVTGSGIDADHYVSFQHAPTFNFSGNLKDNFGLYTTSILNAGNIENNYGVYVANPIKTGGNITTNFGIYLANQTVGSSANYSIYSDGGRMYHAGTSQFDGAMTLGGTGQNLRLKADGTTGADGGLYVGSTGNLFLSNFSGTRGFATLSSGDGYYFGGKFGVNKNSTASYVLDVDGNIGAKGYNFGYATKSANYTLSDNDDYVNVTSSSTITLPNASGRAGKRYVIKAVGSGVVVTMASTSSQTIDGNAAGLYTMSGPNFNVLIVYSDGSNWFVENYATGS